MILLALCQKVTTHESGNVGYFSPAASGSITIARALLQDRPILVLDEATAFADPENEAALIKALAAAMRGRTVIMVAHRLSMVTQADVILLFSDGQLRKWGTIRNCWRRAACINGSGNTISRRSIGCRVEHRKRWWKMKDNNPADNLAWRVNWRQLISTLAVRPGCCDAVCWRCCWRHSCRGSPLPVFIRSLMRCYGRRAATS